VLRQTSTAVHATVMRGGAGQAWTAGPTMVCESSIFEQGYSLLAAGQEQKLAICESESGCRSDVI